MGLAQLSSVVVNYSRLLPSLLVLMVLFMSQTKAIALFVGQVLSIEKTEAIPEPTSGLGVLAFGALGIGSWLKRKRKQLRKTCF